MIMFLSWFRVVKMKWRKSWSILEMKTLDKIHVRQLKNACLYATWSPVGVNPLNLVFLEKKMAFGQEKMKIIPFPSTLRYLFFHVTISNRQAMKLKTVNAFRWSNHCFAFRFIYPNAALINLAAREDHLRMRQQILVQLDKEIYIFMDAISSALFFDI